MKNILKYAWEDIRRGQNIDLYVTIVVSIGLVALSLLGLAPQNLVPTLTLVTIGLLAISGIGNRYRFEEILQQATRSPATVFLDEWPETLRESVQSSSDTLFVGVTLSRTVKTFYEMMREKLSRGDSISILLVEPESAALTLICTRGFFAITPSRVTSEIQATLTDLCHLRSSFPGKLKVKTVNYPIAYGAVMTNPDLPNGIIYFEHYPYRIERNTIPKIVFRASDGTRWFDFYRRELRALWDNGTECDYDRFLKKSS